MVVMSYKETGINKNFIAELEHEFACFAHGHRTQIFLYGDSHCKCFTRDETKIGNLIVKNCYYQGASMRGLSNINSKLKYQPFILDNIVKHSNDYHVFKFGQVDVEYGFWYKKLIKKENIQQIDFFNKTIDEYIGLMLKIKDNISQNIITCGVNLANNIDTVLQELNSTYINWSNGIVKKKRAYNLKKLPRHITVSTQNSGLLTFNNILKRCCDDNCIKYFDTTSECSTKNKAGDIICKDIFKGLDHHYAGAEWKVPSEHHGSYTHYIFLKALLNSITT